MFQLFYQLNETSMYYFNFIDNKETELELTHCENLVITSKSTDPVILIMTELDCTKFIQNTGI